MQFFLGPNPLERHLLHGPTTGELLQAQLEQLHEAVEPVRARWSAVFGTVAEQLQRMLDVPERFEPVRLGRGQAPAHDAFGPPVDI